MEQKTSQLTSLISTSIDSNVYQSEIEEYSTLLDSFKLKYTISGYFLKVGSIDWPQGWILHLSIIRAQFVDLIQTILPILIKECVPFKIVRNRELHRSILDGQAGLAELGKIVKIYPNSDIQAVSIAKQLIELTKIYRGPEILTDRHLGAIVYTRFGAGDSIEQLDENGILQKYIYDDKGQLIPDRYTIPFVLYSWVNWPFSNIASSLVPKKETVLQDKYKTIETLKQDTKGEVKKSLWLKRWYNIKWCIIKEGKKGMLDDDYGRDIRERLVWQYEVHAKLKDILPIPKVYDLFEENEDVFFVMEYIKGKKLDDVITGLFHGLPFILLPISHRQELINYAIQIINIIERMHEEGYVHRDVTPANFLVNSRKNLILIDLELAYQYRTQKPTWPFRLGTDWFMSPQQQVANQPTIYEDIYAVGATLIVLFTGLLPGKFATAQVDILFNQLLFFIPQKNLVTEICNCFQELPSNRPRLSTIKEAIYQFSDSQEKSKSVAVLPVKINNDELENIINCSLRALSTSEFKTNSQLWWSKTAVNEEYLIYQQSGSRSIYCGFAEGLSGVLYTLASSKKCGFYIDDCLEGYTASLDYIYNKYINRPELPTNLYHGSAGVALALLNGVDSGLIPKTSQIMGDIIFCLRAEKVEELSISKGLSGIGLTLLKFCSIFDKSLIEESLHVIVSNVVKAKNRAGNWWQKNENDFMKRNGFANGDSGIICFLLQYASLYKTKLIDEIIVQALNALKRQLTKKVYSQSYKYTIDGSNLCGMGVNNGLAGIALLFLQAYKYFQDLSYKKVAETILRMFPKNVIDRDLSQANGMAGIGEIYIEASNVLKDEEWKERANWIGSFLLHNYRKSNNSCIWLVDGAPFSTADFMTGNSGVIHFLLRLNKPGILDHPLFPGLN